MRTFPSLRSRCVNRYDVDPQGDYVLYWMVASRRTVWNFGLQRAIDWSRELRKPLLVVEALSCNHRWACARFHRFILDGMNNNSRACKTEKISYYAYVEPFAGAGDGLIDALSSRAAVVITDDTPAFFLPRMLLRFARRINTKCEAIDSNGLLPIAATSKCFSRAFDFRRFLQKTLKTYLEEFPDAAPLSHYDHPTGVSLNRATLDQWPELNRNPDSTSLADLPIDHSVTPALLSGGPQAAGALLTDFLDHRLDSYSSKRNFPEEDNTTGLSPYLHFGHISTHQVFHRLMHHVDWQIKNVADFTTGARNDWWGVDENVESLLDQLITWRELGFNMCHHRADYSRYSSLPNWAIETLQKHATDPRPYCYTRESFEVADTHDPLWNAIQRQLVKSGTVHNYLRMLWGKKILEWSESPQEALKTMIHLNNKYALDGRDPNSYSGIFWTLGRYDRAWGPERPIFGKVRYMSSKNTARKYAVGGYLEKWGVKK